MPTDPPAHAADASALRIATFRLARRLRSERAVDSMSDGQFSVLATLRIHGPLALGELAERERVSAPSMNRTVNCLEEGGYVARSADAVDRRKVNVSLTDAGLEVVLETVRRRDAWLEETLATLAGAERDTLARAAEILERLASR